MNQNVWLKITALIQSCRRLQSCRRFFFIGILFGAIVNSCVDSATDDTKLQAPARQQTLNPKENETITPEYQSAFSVAETLDNLISAARDNYTKDIVSKLEKEDAGASVDFKSQHGYVPVPAQLIEAVAVRIKELYTSKGEKFFNLVQRSRWYLSPGNNLKENFEKEGWDFLIKQQERQQKLGRPIKNIKWKPFVRVETSLPENKKVLRYFSPVIVSDNSCVTCHSKWEQQEEIKTIRDLRGVASGKAFKLDEMIGAVSITVPMAENLEVSGAKTAEKLPTALSPNTQAPTPTLSTPTLSTTTQSSTQSSAPSSETAPPQTNT